MDKEFEVVLTGPANVRGKRQRPGQTVCVTRDELRDLSKAKAVAPDALELAPEVETTTAKNDPVDIAKLTSERDDAVQNAAALQSLNEELVAKNKELQGKVDALETDKANLADEIAHADLAFSELKAEFSAMATPDPEPAPKPAAKTTRKTTRKTPAKTTTTKSTAAKSAKS